MGKYIEAEATMKEAVRDNPNKMNKDFLALIIAEKPKGTDNHFTSITTAVTMKKFGKKLHLEAVNDGGTDTTGYDENNENRETDWLEVEKV